MSRPSHAKAVVLESIRYHRGEVSIVWSVDGFQFATSIWYATVDLDELAEQVGTEELERLLFHIALFEVNKGASFRPDTLEIVGDWARFLTPELVDLWTEVLTRVWAQWRYQHGLPDYTGPNFVDTPADRHDASLETRPGTVPNLWFCGGGKDSLLASHVLAKIGESHDSLVYSHSIYGTAASQHRLIERVVDASDALNRHRMYIYDSSMDLPVSELGLYGSTDYVLAAETPSSLFHALPIALSHGYSALLLAHEHSANVGNLVWTETGEDVNHQWGKSLEAERLLGDYVERHLVSNLRYVSVLQPVYDAMIFASLREVGDRIGSAHSCNIEKPWCMRCPKCAYVWISYKAWLDWEPIDATFGHANLLDFPENEIWFRQMLGLEEHTPFECIGQIDEARLAFALAKARGLEGAAMGLLDEVGPQDWIEIADRYLTVHDEEQRMPTAMGEQIVSYFRDQRASALAYVSGLLR